MSERKRFHPLAILIYWFQALRSWLFLLVVFVINGGLTIPFGWMIVVAFLVILLVYSVLKYIRQSYQITPEKILIYQGMLKKREIDIPYDRIQTIKQRQWFFFKPFRVLQILIETAGGDKTKAEASMPAVPEALLDLIERYRRREQATEVETAVYDYEVTNGQIFLYGLTDLSIIASLTALIAFVMEVIPEDWLLNVTSSAESLMRAGWLLILTILFLVFVLTAIISLAKNFIRYYKFRVNRNQQTLTIESGLFERNVQKVPLDKIQSIRIRQQILRKLFNISSVELILAGGQEKEGEGANRKLYLLPIIHDDSLFETLGELLPEWDVQEPAIQYASRTSLWYFWRWNLLWVPVVIGLFWLNGWLGSVLLIAVLFLLLFAWLDYRYQGYAIQSSRRICIQTYELLTKVQTFVERPKIQSFSERTTKWLYTKEIGHIRLFIKTSLGSEAIQLKFISLAHAQKLTHFFNKKELPLT